MIKENLSKIRERISLVCLKMKQDPKQITIVAVSKGRTIEQIKEVQDTGMLDIGENRVQEALLKYKQLSAIRYPLSAIRWHMVGHLQANKAKEAVRIFDLIQSVDSLRLALEINKQAAKISKVQNVLIQINTSSQPSKFGFKPDETIEVIKDMVKLKNINIKGLMTIAPIVDNPEKTRPYFKMLRELRDKINNLQLTAYSSQLLSMGMSNDFEVAIEEGSGMIRLGRVMFSR